MTPAELAVVSDFLRDRFDEATAARMLSVVDVNHVRDLCLRVGMAVRQRAQAIAAGSQMRHLAAEEIDRIDVAAQTDLRLKPFERPPEATSPPSDEQVFTLADAVTPRSGTKGTP